MPYPYTTASLKAKALKGTNPKEDYIDLFQETLEENFYNSSNWWTIQEETIAGANTFVNTDVRIAHVINAETGLKLGDDWKTVLFKEIDHPIELGRLYIFDSNTWLTTNSELIKNLTGSATIRRCNNTLRWIEEDTGAYYEEPCCIEYLVKEPRNYATSGSPFMTPGGFLHIEVQLNSRTNRIKENQRFLFGNAGHWTCYKVIGTGINDFRNMETYSSQSSKVLTLDLTADFVNPELDDIVNGIADVNTNVYTVILNRDALEGAPTDTFTLSTSVIFNGRTVTRNIDWSTSNTNVATVNSNGVVTMVAVGVCTITAKIEDNPAQDTCSITVTNTPSVNYDVVLNPETNYLLEGKERTYSVYLYEDGVQQADTFTITCTPNGVSSASYTFQQVDGNSFYLKNISRNDSSYLTIVLVSGTNTRNYDIYLRGAW